VLPDFPTLARASGERFALSFPGIRLRTCRAGDLLFLRRLYRQLREPELSRTGWPEEFKQNFSDQQFEVQHIDYVRRFVKADFLLVLYGAEPIGRLYVDLAGEQAHLIDIGLLPSWRGRGIGSAVLTALQCHAAQRDASVTLSVDRENIYAQALYRRFGFSETSQSETHLFMRWPRTEAAI